MRLSPQLRFSKPPHCHSANLPWWRRIRGILATYPRPAGELPVRLLSDAFQRTLLEVVASSSPCIMPRPLRAAPIRSGHSPDYESLECPSLWRKVGDLNSRVPFQRLTAFQAGPFTGLRQPSNFFLFPSHAYSGVVKLRFRHRDGLAPFIEPERGNQYPFKRHWRKVEDSNPCTCYRVSDFESGRLPDSRNLPIATGAFNHSANRAEARCGIRTHEDTLVSYPSSGGRDRICF